MWQCTRELGNYGENLEPVYLKKYGASQPPLHRPNSKHSGN